MKIALITDTHYGVRNDNKLFLENNRRFLSEVFFPYIDEHGIRTVVHAGDLLDRRKYVNIYTAKRLREDFIDPIRARDIDFHITLGNHDTHFKDTNEVNSVTELLGSLKCKIYTNARTVRSGGKPILFLPWICDNNREHSLNEIKKTNAKICIGHLNISGFEMHRGSISMEGQDKSVFDKFDTVYSGHFHHRSTDGHIFYLGASGQYTWSDYNDVRGFHILDTETNETTFVVNPFEVFKKLHYDDQLPKDFIDVGYKDCIIKVIVRNKSNPYVFEKFIEELEKTDPYDVQVVDDNLNLNLEDEADIVSESESTLDICTKYIKTLAFGELDMSKIETKLIELYNLALETGE